MVIHVVQKGDSLFSIGRSYGIAPEKVAGDNAISLGLPPVVGQTLVLDVEQTPKRGAIEVNGYAFHGIAPEVLDKALPHLTYLSIYAHRLTPEGRLAGPEDQGLIALCNKQQTLPVLVVSNLDAEGFNQDLACKLATDVSLQRTMTTALLQTMQKKGYAGADMAMEGIPAYCRADYDGFLTQLGETLRREGYFLSATLTGLPRPYAGETNRLRQGLDTVTLMAMDRGLSYKVPGPVAPMPQITASLDAAAPKLQNEMLFVGIPTHGYSWTLSDIWPGPAATVTGLQAVDTARRYHAHIQYDTDAQAPYFEYVSEKGTAHQVWFEDARSLRAKLNLPFRYNLAGVTLCNVGFWCPQFPLVLQGLYDVVKM